MWGDAVLWDNAPHSCSTYTASSGRDSGGGVSLSYALAQSGIACLINTASSSTVEMYGQEQVTVSHTVSFKASALTTSLARGMKIVADDGSSYHVEGIRSGRAFLAIPAFVYADCRQML